MCLFTGVCLIDAELPGLTWYTIRVKFSRISHCETAQTVPILTPRPDSLEPNPVDGNRIPTVSKWPAAPGAVATQALACLPLSQLMN